jgi:hypothetical protein
VTQALEEAGVATGDTVLIGALEFAWGWSAEEGSARRRRRRTDQGE